MTMDGPDLEALQEPLDLPPHLRSPRAAEQHSESLPAPSERHLQGEGSQEQQRAQERAAQVWGNNGTVDLLHFCSPHHLLSIVKWHRQDLQSSLTLLLCCRRLSPKCIA